MSTPIVIIHDWSEPFEIMFNASDYAVGAVSGQRRKITFRVAYDSSKTLNDASLTTPLQRRRCWQWCLHVTNLDRTSLGPESSFIQTMQPFVTCFQEGCKVPSYSVDFVASGV